ncbi:DUF3784 domain-containing protein [Marinilabilia sp.]|uniref:DUF3784 domain-containing protein n=1 Tax=Marinilabilia sp. TaxID=2021252 RepID=UPI0025BF8CD4|nr:DUF3784 domain-containing protein [Marinilabilia sp.]
MNVFVLVFGCMFVGIGLLVRNYPDLIAGYNTLPEEKKARVDIKGLAIIIRSGLIVIGTGVILIFYILKLIGFIEIARLMVVIVPIVGVVILVIRVQKFNTHE